MQFSNIQCNLTAPRPPKHPRDPPRSCICILTRVTFTFSDQSSPSPSRVESSSKGKGLRNETRRDETHTVCGAD
jgi:hypothetical protein